MLPQAEGGRAEVVLLDLFLALLRIRIHVLEIVVHSC